MAKSKYAPALFEVINRQRNTGKLSVPKWWKGSGQAETPEARNSASPLAGDVAAESNESGLTTSSEPLVPDVAERLGGPQVAAEVVSGLEASDQPPLPMTHRDENDSCARQPVFQLDAGRIWISLSTAQAGIAVGVLLAALVVSFGLGRMGGSSALSPQPSDDVAGKLAETPNPSVLNAAHDKGATGTANRSGMIEKKSDAASDDELKPGLCYVLLDSYNRSDRASAEHVQKWLAKAHGIQTVLRQTEKKYLLISKAGFDWSNPAEQEKCKELSERVKSLGKECKGELTRADLRVYVFASPQIFQKKE